MPAFPSEGLPSQRDYVAPTVFKKNGIGITTGWNYYGTLGEAIVKWKFLNNKPGGSDVAPEGTINFQPNTSAQTAGINVDFYILQSDGRWYLTNYKYLRGLVSYPSMIYRFYTIDGVGPYWAIFDPARFGIAATSIDSVSPDKLAALDDFYRELALLKYRYNSLAGFMNGLSLQTLSPQEQQIYNEGTLKLQQMAEQMKLIKGIEISFTDKGAVVGVLPILLIIAIIAILAAATAWTITEITSMKERTRQINDAFQLNQWVADKKTQLATMVTSGQITQDQATDINHTLDKAQIVANKVADNASKTDSPGLFGEITGLVKWGIIGFVVVEGFKLFKENRNARTATT
jgi:hypothetical protein